MLVILIPFFLAAHIGVRENEIGIKEKWINGPEVIYDVRVESVSYPFETVTYPFEETEAQIIFNETVKLACREKSHSTLNCHLYNPDSSTDETRKPKKNVKQQPGDERFELNFDRDGAQSIVLPSSLNDVSLNVVKSFVAQMSIDAHIFNARTNNFEAWENFTTGTCRTNYSITSMRKTRENDVDTTMMRPYEIFVLPSMRAMKNERLEIKKRRNLNKCLRRIDYFFGSDPNYRPSYMDVNVNSSESHTTIGEQEFTSWTESTIFVSNKFNSSGHRLMEKITLSLNDIVPASGPLPLLGTPIFASSIFPARTDGSEDKSYSEEESYSEEINDSEENNDLSRSTRAVVA